MGKDILITDTPQFIVLMLTSHQFTIYLFLEFHLHPNIHNDLL